MEIAPPPARVTPAAGSAVPAPGVEHRAALLRYAARLLEDVALATEVVDAVLDAAARSGEGASAEEGPERAEEKLFAACRRRVLARLREAGQAVREAGVDDPTASLTTQVERLPPKQREAVWLRFASGFGDEAIARITGQLVHNVNFLLHTALAKLAALRAGGAVPGLEDVGVTAYVLETMESDEREGFAAALKQDKVARAAVATVRGLARELSDALDDGSARRRPAGGRSRRGARRWRMGAWGWVVAGLLVVGVAGGWWWWQRPVAVAAREATPSTEDFRLKPDAWKLARAQAAAENAPTPRASAAGGATATQTRPVAVAPVARDRARAEVREPVVQAPRAVSDGAPGPARTGGERAGVVETPGEIGRAVDTAGEAGAPSGPTSATVGPETADGVGAVAPSATAPRASGGERAMNLPVRPSAGGVKPAGAAAARDGGAGATPEPAVTQNAAVERAPRAPVARAEAGVSRPAAGVLTAAGAVTRAHAAERPAGKSGPGTVAGMLAQFNVEGRDVVAEPGLAVEAEVAAAPWDATRRLVRVVVRGGRAPEVRAAAHVVLLVDVSASMEAPDRLPLVQAAARRLLAELHADDRVSLVTYAETARVVLPATPVARAAEIGTALGALRAEGATNGGAGLRRAYEAARAGWVQGGVNRVVWCTDGDFNVGVTSEAELAAWVSAEAKAGVTLSVIGFGRGRQIDARLELLAARGRGRGTYVNTRHEAEERLRAEASGPRANVARDVRVALDGNPASVAAVRLVGVDDLFLPVEAAARRKWDAGDVRAGETHVALFELVPAAGERARLGPGVGEVTLRVERAGEGEAAAQQVKVRDAGVTFAEASVAFKFSATVAALGLALREAPVADAKLAEVERWAEAVAAEHGVHDPAGYRAEFLALAREAREAEKGK